MKYSVKKIHVLFRFDDTSANSNTKAEIKIFDAFRKLEFNLCVSVIPFLGEIDGSVSDGRALVPFPLDKSAILINGISDGSLEIALHGFSHFSISKANPTEFMGLALEEQKQMLKAGKSYLESLLNIHIDVFVPPFNTYDINTVHALDYLDFRVLSAGIYGSAISSASVLFVPATCSLKSLKAAVCGARHATDCDPLVVVLFHHYDFKEVDGEKGTLTFDDLNSLLAWVAEQPDLAVISMQQATERFAANLSARRFIAIDKWRKLECFLPNRMREKKPVLYYHEEAVLPSLYRKLVLLYFCLFMLSGLCTFLLMSVLSLFLPYIMEIATWSAAILFMLTAVYAIRNLSIGQRGLTTVSISSGIFCGALSRHLFC